ncbi:response regulator [Alteromonas sp. KUL49]|uniref:response regulator n=1 Tax=Alteromonas sp. KUL49 TaxID=2480798 RepID=UPI00102F0266|nr:response regulator [Alteromonas sp. KUL49]TAP35505.1 response regulator [Alteromonas sp. KUL49]GEA13384.1 DNA-binding response regulator [Alteromonas sp. KUL49]
MNNKHILIVEDEVDVADSVKNFLHKAGFKTSHLESGEPVIEFVNSTPVDLILLDIMLPGMSGLEVCKGLRSFSNIPIFMLTACAEESQRLEGLELGADDYISKPFSAPELVLRVTNFLKRFGGGEPTLGLSVNKDEFSASFNGEKIGLTKAELELIALLQKRPNQAFTREQILNSIYSDYRDVSDRTVDTHIKNLRKKLKAVSPEHEYIQAVYGVGYRYVLA